MRAEDQPTMFLSTYLSNSFFVFVFSKSPMKFCTLYIEDLQIVKVSPNGSFSMQLQNIIIFTSLSLIVVGLVARCWLLIVV